MSGAIQPTAMRTTGGLHDFTTKRHLCRFFRSLATSASELPVDQRSERTKVTRRADEMRIHQLAVNEAILSLHTGPAGLTSTEAERRLGEFGPNRVDPIRGTPVATRLFRAFAHFFALILWVAAGLAFIAESQEPGSGMRTLGLAILGVMSLYLLAGVSR